jgi:hypothetical protein
MRIIRLFLWGLVATMTLHGFLHADEYGTATSFVGGVSLTLSIWKESLWDGLRSLIPGTDTRLGAAGGIPRAFVIAALRESIRHPGLSTLPTLRRALAEHRHAWETFREVEVQWMLRHADLMGALRSEGRDIWEPWTAVHDAATAELTAEKKKWCVAAECSAKRKAVIDRLTATVERAAAAVSVWERLMFMDPSLAVLTWWNTTVSADKNLTERIGVFEQRLTALHNVTRPTEARVRALETTASAIATTINVVTVWHQPILHSLLLRDLWTACLDHIRRRENRVQELMVMAGVQDLYNTHERIQAAALRVVASSTPAEIKQVHGWFDEAAAHAWWLTDEIPAIVRRCVGQSTGECRRIGPTEIAALTAQYDERTRIVDDWNRRLFIGLWNAMPAVGLLFVLEVIVLLLPQRRIYTVVTADSGMAALTDAPQRPAVPLAIKNN